MPRHLTLVDDAFLAALESDRSPLSPIHALQVATQVARDHITDSAMTLPDAQKALINDAYNQVMSLLTQFENTVLVAAFRTGAAQFSGAPPTY